MTQKKKLDEEKEKVVGICEVKSCRRSNLPFANVKRSHVHQLHKVKKALQLCLPLTFDDRKNVISHRVLRYQQIELDHVQRVAYEYQAC